MIAKDNFQHQKIFLLNLKNLWNIFDSQGWSIWIIKYTKAEQEGKMLISFRNNCNGFLQRTDPKFKKLGICYSWYFMEIPNLQISGVWIWRGTQIPLFLIRDYFIIIQIEYPTFEYYN